jgi:hypothetical protein
MNLDGSESGENTILTWEELVLVVDMWTRKKILGREPGFKAMKRLRLVDEVHRRLSTVCFFGRDCSHQNLQGRKQ